jgi:hypothetical protein
MHIATQASKSTASSVINFATETKTSLAALIAAFADAERKLGEAIDADEAITHKPAKIRILGGISPATVIATEGKEPVTIPASEWFYHSREDIERDRDRFFAEASAEDRVQVVDRFSTLLREYDEQSEANERAIPKGKHKAELRLAKAHRELSAVERKIINFKPSGMTEAVALLEYASRGKRYCFTADEADLHTIMRNAASAIRAAQ